MKVWLVQFEAKLNDKQENLRKIIDYVGKASEHNVDLIAFPEMALTGYQCHRAYYELAEPIPGFSTEKIIERIKKGGPYVIFGMPEIKGDYIYNSAPLIGPEGLKGVCRKINLATYSTDFSYGDDGMFFKAGSEFAVFDTRFGKIGIQICKDLVYPEVSRALALKGAWLLICPAVAVGVPSLHIMARARAVENVANVCWINVAGLQEDIAYWGGTCAINHLGDFIKTASIGKDAKEEIVECEMDRDIVVKARLSSVFLKEGRPDIMHKVASIYAEL